MLTIEDRTPDDGQAASASVSWGWLYGYAEHQLNGGPYFSTTPFTVAPGSTLDAGDSYAAEAAAKTDGSWSASAFMESNIVGFTSANILDAGEITVGANTKVTLHVAVDAFTQSNDPLNDFMNGAVAYGNIQIDVDGQSFLDQITAFVYGAGSDHKTGIATVSFSTGDRGVTGQVYRAISANPYINTPVTPPVPEPSAYALVLVGLGMVCIVSRRKQSRCSSGPSSSA